MESLYRNKTWEIVKRSHDQKLVACIWLYKIKEGSPAKDPVRFKARLMAKGLTQVD